jgi:hypothetical protein
MTELFSLLQSYLLIYKWIQSLPRGVSLGRKASGEGVDHILYIFCNTLAGEDFHRNHGRTRPKRQNGEKAKPLVGYANSGGPPHAPIPSVLLPPLSCNSCVLVVDLESMRSAMNVVMALSSESAHPSLAVLASPWSREQRRGRKEEVPTRPLQ